MGEIQGRSYLHYPMYFDIFIRVTLEVGSSGRPSGNLSVGPPTAEVWSSGQGWPRIPMGG